MVASASRSRSRPRLTRSSASATWRLRTARAWCTSSPDAATPASSKFASRTCVSMLLIAAVASLALVRHVSRSTYSAVSRFCAAASAASSSAYRLGTAPPADGGRVVPCAWLLLLESTSLATALAEPPCTISREQIKIGLRETLKRERDDNQIGKRASPSPRPVKR